MASRIMFYIQVFALAICIATGMSETFAKLAWARPLIPLIILFLTLSLISPIIILALAVYERKKPDRILAAVFLSIVMTIASFFAILPLCQ